MWNEGAPRNNSHLQPPLAKDLFDIGQHPEYSAILSRYPGTEFLARQLGPVAPQGEQSLEVALRDLANHQDPGVNKQFNQIPLYLRNKQCL